MFGPTALLFINTNFLIHKKKFFKYWSDTHIFNVLLVCIIYFEINNIINKKMSFLMFT